jgi:hypothetical protein
MHHRLTLAPGAAAARARNTTAALGAAALALALAPAALAARGPTVTVRVEGVKRTLLAPTIAHTHTGWITKGGTPTGQCSATSATGALDVATHHRWRGTWDSSFNALFVSSILGETHTLKSKDFWSVWVDNRFAQFGVCGLKLHRGEQLVFAAVPDTFKGHLLGLDVGHTAAVSQSLSVKVVWFNKRGKPRPLAGARVRGKGVNVVTDRHGIAHITPPGPGTLVLQASHKGDIRSAPTRVHVS